METQPSLPWPGADERAVVGEMLGNPDSQLWEECSNFVQRCVHARARNIPTNFREEIIQEVMYKVTKYLPDFHFQCSLKSWLYPIIEHCIIDVHRWRQNEGRFNVPLSDPLDANDKEVEGLNASGALSAEDVSLVNDDLRNALTALLEYTNAHSHPMRDRLIIRMVIFEGQTRAETAKAAGCSVPVVGHVVREAQRYTREKMRHKL